MNSSIKLALVGVVMFVFLLTTIVSGIQIGYLAGIFTVLNFILIKD